MKYLGLYIMMLLGFFVQAQEPIQWKKNLKDLGNNTYEVSVTAQLDKGWHLYSTENTSEYIIPTTVKFLDNPNIQWLEKQQVKGEKKKIFSPAYGEDLIEFVSDVVYSRKFKTSAAQPFKIISEIEYQVCNERTCLAPQTIEIDIPVTPKKGASTSNEIPSNTQTPTTENLPANTPTASTAIDSIANEKDSVSAGVSHQQVSENTGLIIPSIDVEHPLDSSCIVQTSSKNLSYFWLFVFGFIGGLLALITPCVYPMIPLTISYFTKSSKEHSGKRNAFLYAIFIFIIFVLISLPFHLFTIQTDIFNQISTNIYVNLFFFAIFIFFAFSFFGYYDLTLPQSWINKSDNLSSSSGIIGVFFMALTLVIVSFSCTGPILGGLLGSISGENGAQKLTSAFSGFGLSWALIFGVFALFPSFLDKLPKSGGWLNTTKVVLGFVELALALKFLSKADLVSKTFLLKRELFVLFWIVIAVLVVLYLLGFIRFPHDERPNKITTGKKIGAVAFLAFAIYMLPGLFPNHNKPNLYWLGGLTPPLTVSYFYEEDSCPLGLECYHDYFQALEKAQLENKPILIDFTGWGCENCRKMEQNVWSDKKVFEILDKEVIVASLYVDDKEPLKNPYPIKLPNGSRRIIKTIGDKWSIFQKENFKEQTQPHYVLITPDQKVINYPVGGYMKKEDFLKFLECGISYYKKHYTQN